MVLIKRGQRHYIHPKLSVLDDIECDVWYNKDHKFFYVEYDYGYDKSILTKDVDAIQKEISSFIINKNQIESKVMDDNYQWGTKDA